MISKTTFSFFVTHIQIFIYFISEEYLTADEPCSADEKKRCVYLKKENYSDMQLWKIELST